MRKKVSVFFMIISGFVLLFWVFGGLFVFVLFLDFFPPWILKTGILLHFFIILGTFLDFFCLFMVLTWDFKK